jgi:hypothetical protein
MEEMLETMDNIRNQTRKKLDSIYQLIMVTKRRRRLREMKKLKEERARAKLSHESEPAPSHNSKNPVAETAAKEEEAKTRRLNRMRSYNYDRALQMESPQYYSYGRIPNEEGSFHAMMEPNLIRASV